MESLRFPLPLRRYESFMLHDESPSYPMTYVIELRLTGRLHREPFEAALQTTLELHPLLRARVERSGWRRSVWAAVEPSSVNWQNGPIATPPASINIEREPGLCTWVEDDPHNPRILFQFHHAATDGVGAIQFIGDVLARYGVSTTASGDVAPEPAAVNVQRLCEREQLWPAPQFRRHLLRRTVRRCWELSRTRPQPVAGLPTITGRQNEPTKRTTVFPSYHTQVIVDDDYDRLRRSTRGLFTLNDLAALAMFRTLRDWNRRLRNSPAPHWLRLSLPFSLRLPIHDDSPAANQLSLMMLSRHESQIDDDAELLSYIHRATGLCAQTCEGRLFTFWMGGVAQWCPWLFKFGPKEGCFCSAILANIGDVRRHLRGRFPLDQGRIVAGSVRLDALLGAACVRPGARVAASLGSYAGKLFINLNVDPLTMPDGAGPQLLQLFTAHLLAAAGVVPASAASLLHLPPQEALQ
jgi:hypothetical protein